MFNTVFQQATLASLHTGIAMGVAHHYNTPSPVEAGVASYVSGMLGLVFGSFAGDAATYSLNMKKYDHAGATIGGLLGYAIGSTAGFCLKQS